MLSTNYLLGFSCPEAIRTWMRCGEQVHCLIGEADLQMDGRLCHMAMLSERLAWGVVNVQRKKNTDYTSGDG
jgi:hypothetical protein